MERIGALASIVLIVCVMLTNIITHFMMVKRLPLSPFQEAWLSWGAVTVFILVLILVLFIGLSNPVSKLTRQELRIQGKQQESILYAREQGLGSEHVQTAMLERGEWEGQQLADRIIGSSRQVGYGSTVQTPGLAAPFRRPSRARRPLGKGQSHQD